MNFSPSIIPSLIVTPLRYFFSKYGSEMGFVWDADEKKRSIDISHTNDYFKIPLHEKPRILVDRGPYQLSKVGVSDNMAEQKPHMYTHGLRDKVNMLLAQGTAQLVVEARNLGTCDILADLTQRFITWARPAICDSQGFKDFALPLNVSEPRAVEREDTEKFQVMMQIPWIKECHWRDTDDGVILKDILYKMEPASLVEITV